VGKGAGGEERRGRGREKREKERGMREERRCKS